MQQRLIYGGKQMCVRRLGENAERRLSTNGGEDRSDEKTASEYSLEGGATLHLVLALRGGC